MDRLPQRPSPISQTATKTISQLSNAATKSQLSNAATNSQLSNAATRTIILAKTTDNNQLTNLPHGK